MVFSFLFPTELILIGAGFEEAKDLAGEGPPPDSGNVIETAR